MSAVLAYLSRVHGIADRYCETGLRLIDEDSPAVANMIIALGHSGRFADEDCAAFDAAVNDGRHD